ncbi:lipase, putative, partial [Ixodes scapularis]
MAGMELLNSHGVDGNGIDFAQATDQSDTGSINNRATITVSSTASLGLAAHADTLVRALLQHQDRNVLEILWNVGECQLNGSDFYYCPENSRSSDVRWYQEAASDARLVARVVARMLNRFVNNYDYDLTRAHFIGFGLGAHVGGFVADELGYTGNVLGRLTALDAASPLFESQGLSRLSPSSALRVEAVHTGGARPCGLGMAGPLGTLDIYVNGGERQPHCNGDRMCSHLAALGYYAQSVERCLADAVSTPLPGYWTDITGIVNVRSLAACRRVSVTLHRSWRLYPVWVEGRDGLEGQKDPVSLEGLASAEGHVGAVQPVQDPQDAVVLDAGGRPRSESVVAKLDCVRSHSSIIR